MTPRDAAVEIVRRLRGGGYTAYLAGGCVRDELLGEEPKDFDVATDARPDGVRALFRRTAEVGAAFGVMLVREFGPTVEVATFRSDGPYTDRRRPDTVAFADAEADARRRDFTINALFIDPLAGGAGRIIDFVGGRADLEARVLRAVGDPDRRLAEDHLRALRGVRFAARYGLSIDPGTAEAMRRHAGRLEGVSRERIGEEMRRMLTHPSRGRAGRLLHELGLDAAVLGPGRGAYDGSALDGLGAGAGYAAALMALAIGRGLAPAGGGAGAVSDLRRALLLSNDQREAVRDGFAALRGLLAEWDGLGEAGRKRLASSPGYADAMEVLGVLDPARAAAVRAEVGRLAGRFGGLRPRPLLDGDGLVAMGLAPGPRFARVLAAVYDAQLEGRVADADAARALALELWADADGGGPSGGAGRTGR